MEFNHGLESTAHQKPHEPSLHLLWVNSPQCFSLLWILTMSHIIPSWKSHLNLDPSMPVQPRLGNFSCSFLVLPPSQISQWYHLKLPLKPREMVGVGGLHLEVTGREGSSEDGRKQASTGRAAGREQDGRTHTQRQEYGEITWGK